MVRPSQQNKNGTQTLGTHQLRPFITSSRPESSINPNKRPNVTEHQRAAIDVKRRKIRVPLLTLGLIEA